MPYLVIALAVALISSIGFGLYNYKKSALLERELVTTSATIKMQNEKIHQLALDTEQYLMQAETQQQDTVQVYEKVVIQKDSTCETKLREIESLLETFNRKRK